MRGLHKLNLDSKVPNLKKQAVAKKLWKRRVIKETGPNIHTYYEVAVLETMFTACGDGRSIGKE